MQVAHLLLVEQSYFTELNNMSKPMIRIHNIETNEVIDREMTNAEFAEYEAVNAKLAEQKAEAEARATQKAALLERLGLTQEEFNTLTA
jgi:hypothetical protein